MNADDRRDDQATPPSGYPVPEESQRQPEPSDQPTEGQGAPAATFESGDVEERPLGQVGEGHGLVVRTGPQRRGAMGLHPGG